MNGVGLATGNSPRHQHSFTVPCLFLLPACPSPCHYPCRSRGKGRGRRRTVINLLSLVLQSQSITNPKCFLMSVRFLIGNCLWPAKLLTPGDIRIVVVGSTTGKGLKGQHSRWNGMELSLRHVPHILSVDLEHQSRDC